MRTKTILIFPLALLLAGCALTTVNEASVMQGATEAKVFELSGAEYNYDQIWRAAESAMGNGMHVIESHKPSGTIKSRMSAASTGKVVGFFIRPTTPTATTYQIEIVSKKPVSLTSLPEPTSWEPSVLADFKVALAQPTRQAAAGGPRVKSDPAANANGTAPHQSPAGTWLLNQDGSGKTCAITFTADGSSAGYLLIRAESSASLIFVGPKIPPVSQSTKQTVTLISGRVPQTVSAMHLPNNNKNGTVVVAMTTMQAAMREMTDTADIDVTLNGSSIFRLQWTGGLKARDSMLKCMSRPLTK